MQQIIFNSEALMDSQAKVEFILSLHTFRHFYKKIQNISYQSINPHTFGGIACENHIQKYKIQNLMF